MQDPDALELETPADWLGIVATATRATLRLENSVARNRTLGYLAGSAAKLYETTEIDERLTALEEIVQRGDR